MSARLEEELRPPEPNAYDPSQEYTEFEQRLQQIITLPPASDLSIQEFDPVYRSRLYAAVLRKPGDPDPNVIALLKEGIPSKEMEPEMYTNWNNVVKEGPVLPEHLADPARIKPGLSVEKYLEVVEKQVRRADRLKREEEARLERLRAREAAAAAPPGQARRKTMRDFMASREGSANPMKPPSRQPSEEPILLRPPRGRRGSLGRQPSFDQFKENYERLSVSRVSAGSTRASVVEGGMFVVPEEAEATGGPKFLLEAMNEMFSGEGKSDEA
ncbi:hypothetical protein HDV00_003883 [Rhizophlyctis rosea]|nr:hypothetical protein HDV00_003883 [Rhizophlyctis rosea]